MIVKLIRRIILLLHSAKYLVSICVLLSCTLTVNSQNIIQQASDSVVKRVEKAEEFIAQGNYNEGISILREFDTDLQNLISMGISVQDYSYFLYKIGYCHKGNKDYYRALEYFLKAESVLPELMKNYAPHIVDLYDSIVLSYISIKNAQKALEWGKKRLNFTIRQYGRNTEATAMSYRILFIIQLHCNDQGAALENLDKYFNIKNKLFDNKFVVITEGKLMLEYVRLAYNLNQIEKALSILEMMESNFEGYKIDPLLYLSALNIKTLIYFDKDPTLIPAIFDKISSIIDSMENIDLVSDEINIAYNNMALYYKDHDSEGALSIFLSLRDNYISQKNTNNAAYAITLNNIGMLVESLEEAKNNFKSAFKIVRNLPGVDISQILTIAYNWIEVLTAYGDFDTLENVLKEVNEILADRINTTFPSLTERNRLLYWNQIQHWYNDVLPLYSILLDSPSLWGVLYDGLLQSRSILLSSSISLKNLVEQSNDSNLRILYSQYNELNPKSDESLRESLEQRLVREIKGYGNFMETFTISHKDVKDSLEVGEVAIEFVHFSIDEEESPFTDYIALIQFADREDPIKVNICNDDALNGWTLESLYHDIWSPMKDELKNISQIYFSPDGELFSIPIEYAKCSDGLFFNEKVNVKRLSSSREITKRVKNEGEGIALFGGMKFDLTVDEMIVDSNRYRDMTEEFVRQRAPRDLIDKLESLPGTLVEVESIHKVLSSLNSKEKVELYKSDLATEAAFKSYSGQRPRILHIASHGFYEKPSVKLVTDIMTDENEIVNFEQSEMRHSGLLFSGADNVRMDEPVPAEIEDGVLDAFEISSLDFNGTDLVVLSACQTGLGTISGDGVFGLQRGFKKAGVRSIMMSLWKVDDDATCALMTEFYKNLFINKDNKNDALKKAQNYVRSNPAWEDYRYWGGFIILD